MLRIHLRTLYSTLEAPRRVLRELDQFFSVEIPGIQYNRRLRYVLDRYRKLSEKFGHFKALEMGAWDGRQHFVRKDGRIPTGLVPLIPDSYEPIRVDHRSSLSFARERELLDRVEKLKLHGIELSDFQREAIRRAIRFRRGILKMATNAGKTEVAGGILKVLDQKSLYVIHRKELLHQTAARLQKRLGVKVSKIGDGLFQTKRQIVIGMVQSLPKPIKANQDFYDQFKVLILDETQHGSANTWNQIAMACPAPWRFGLSGTPFTGDDLKDLRLMGCLDSKIIINVANQELIDRGWSAKPTIHMWAVPFKENDWSYNKAVDLMIVGDSHYNEQIVQIVKSKWEDGLPTLVLVDRKIQGSHLMQRLVQERVSCRYLNGSHQPAYRVKTLKDFREGRVGVVVATPILDEGVDVPAIRCLVLAPGGKSAIRLLQRVGRALRKKNGPNIAEIHDFIHYGNFYLLRHSQKRMDTYKEEGFKLVFEEPMKV